MHAFSASYYANLFFERKFLYLFTPEVYILAPKLYILYYILKGTVP